jgi:hypothetical protein
MTHRTGRRNDTAAPVAEPVAIGRDRDRRAGGQVVGDDEEARVKCVPNTMIMGVGCGNS